MPPCRAAPKKMRSTYVPTEPSRPTLRSQAFLKKRTRPIKVSFPVPGVFPELEKKRLSNLHSRKTVCQDWKQSSPLKMKKFLVMVNGILSDNLINASSEWLSTNLPTSVSGLKIKKGSSHFPFLFSIKCFAISVGSSNFLLS